MPLYAFEGRSPKVDPTAFVAPTAVLVGVVIDRRALTGGGSTPIRRPIGIWRSAIWRAWARST